MKNAVLILLGLILYIVNVKAQETVFEQSNGMETATYAQTIEYYKQLAKTHSTIRIDPIGETDTDYPLHVVFYAADGNLNIKNWHSENRLIILINNGIHPGEPDGIDASMMLLRDAAVGKIKVPQNVVLAVIPVYNIGGALNRNSFSRANQNGPLSYGFRGNAQNLDLNRDFIKMDAKETQTLVKLFHMLDPDVFIDNHVSNGADYQYTVTLLSTQHSKLGGSMGEYLNNTFEPLIYKDMKQRGHDIVPYVNVWGTTPDKGWQAFMESPRFASGFGAMFQTYSFVTETHMLKPYKDRVLGTYALMESFIKVSSVNAANIKSTRKQDRENFIRNKTVAIDWVIDTTKKTLIPFNGYEARYEPSGVSGKPRLLYDRTKPYAIQVPFYNFYKPKIELNVPKAYIVRQGWSSVVDKMRLNGVSVKRVEQDTIMDLSVYYIKDYNTTTYPYESHYLHSNVTVRKEDRKVKVMKGDYIVKTNQKAKRYIIEVLEPEAPDAFFAWGYFDGILQQKEHYSSYVFEDVALQLIQDNEVLYDEYKTRINLDTSFANNGAAQLDFIYKNSPYYEQTHMQYPVFRVEY